MHFFPTSSNPKSIRQGLVLVLILLQAATVFIMLGLSRATTESVMVTQAQSILLNAANESLEHVRGFLRPAQRTVTTVAELLNERVLNTKVERDVELQLLSLLQNNRELAGFYIATTDGSFIYVSRNTEVDGAIYRSKFIRFENNEKKVLLRWRDAKLQHVRARYAPKDQYTPLSRPWYQQATGKQGFIWTDPYTFFSAQKPGITAAAPFFNSDGSIAGVVGADIELTALCEFLEELNTSKNGSAFIVNQEETLIALSTPEGRSTPMKDYSLSSIRKINDIDHKVVNRAFKKFSNRSADTTQHRQIKASFEVGDTEYVAAFVPFELSGDRQWLIGIQAPKGDFLQTLQQNQNTNLILGVGVLLLSILTGWILVTHTSRPIDELQNQANSDHLTHLFNRRHLHEIAEKTFAEMQTTRQPLSIAMIDIDHFKSINDLHGHSVGDEVLTAFAGRLKSSLRDTNLVARYGGEEFIVLLPNTEIEVAQSLLERIRKSIESNAFRTSIGLANLTISIGIAAMHSSDTNWNDILDRADKHLYQAKTDGRNQTVAATSD